MTFSATSRLVNLSRMKSEKLDLLIIGGGITGAGISLAASARGIKTGLIEMQDFAAGTSSRSTKLIHGGLRYLKQFEVQMVAEVSQEREIIHQNAGHIVRPTRMMLPIYREPGVSFDSFSGKVALKLYDELAKVKEEYRHYFITREEAREREPALQEDNLAEAGIYLDYTSDDARLTLEILKKAHEYHSLLANYVKAVGFLYDEKENIIGVRARDQITQEEFSIQAAVVINATGPWAFQTQQLAAERVIDRMRPTKGIHLVFDKNRLPVQSPIYLDTGLQDQRMIFIIPRKDKTYIGTTDTDYKGDIAQPEVTREDVAYLLKVVNERFPTVHLTLEDIEASWVGLRPLVTQEDVANPSAISRDSSLTMSEDGLITIAGGKLTDYRRMAEEALEKIAAELQERVGKTYVQVDTAKIRLSGGEEVEECALIQKGLEVGLEEMETKQLMDWYGSNTRLLLDLARKTQPFAGLSLADSLSLRYALEYEMTLTPEDYFARRTDMMFFDVSKMEKIRDSVGAAMAGYYHWTDSEKDKMREELERSLAKSKLTHLKA